MSSYQWFNNMCDTESHVTILTQLSQTLFFWSINCIKSLQKLLLNCTSKPTSMLVNRLYILFLLLTIQCHTLFASNLRKFLLRKHFSQFDYNFLSKSLKININLLWSNKCTNFRKLCQKYFLMCLFWKTFVVQNK